VFPLPDPLGYGHDGDIGASAGLGLRPAQCVRQQTAAAPSRGSDRQPANVVIVGASLAGLRTAQALRRNGYDRPITLIGDELELPYDRPPLSKEFSATIDAPVPFLTTPEEFAALDVTFVGGSGLRRSCPPRPVGLGKNRCPTKSWSSQQGPGRDNSTSRA